MQSVKFTVVASRLKSESSLMRSIIVIGVLLFAATSFAGCGLDSKNTVNKASDSGSATTASVTTDTSSGVSEATSTANTTEKPTTTTTMSESDPIIMMLRKAKEYMKGVEAEVNVTTLNQLKGQMPRNIEPRIEIIAADERIYTWTFSDGSQIVGVFKQGENGDKQDFVLDSIEVVE